MRAIRKVAVIGAGVMGAGIAAHIANAGVPVLLLDVSRDAAAAARQRLMTIEPPALMDEGAARLIETGGIDEDMARIAACDWIIEAIVEKPEVKRALYSRIAHHRAVGAAVSSNTSTIPLADLTRDAGAGFRRSFLITHFFNPPRYMRLLEIVTGPETDRDLVKDISRFADHHLGKSIVVCKDRPGFIANRLGCFWMQAAIATAFAQGVTVEEADAVLGKPFGIPKTGVFGLADLVGIDLLPHVNSSLAAALEADDLFHSVNVRLPMVDAMIAEGYTGRKGKGGFYRINRAEGKRKEAMDLATGAYHPVKPVALANPAGLMAEDSRLGRYARAVMVKTLGYAAGLLGDAADNVQSIDEAMRLGYNWTYGPFELIDRVGTATVRQLLAGEGLPVPAILKAPEFYRAGLVLAPSGGYVPVARPEGVLALADVKRTTAALLKNASASLWDVGDGVSCFELTTKMNTLDAAAFDLLTRSLDHVATHGRAMVIYSDAANFSAGVDLNWMMVPAKAGDWTAVEDLVRLGQVSLKRLKYAGVPVVAAVAGLALGGGCELLLHCAAVQAHAETYAGLVETGVGILPAWGGCGELLLRWQAGGRLPKGPMPAIGSTFEIIATASVSKSAAHARHLRFLRAGDAITMNRARLLADAKAKALALAADYHPPLPPVFALPGPSARVALGLAVQAMAKLGKASPHDVRVADALAIVLSGGGADITRPLGEDAMLALERAEVMQLARTPETQARIEHMLETGKPLRN